MQIVVDIPEEVLNSIKTFKGKFICKNGYDLIQGIKNSTPLPKGHGRLIDADAVLEEPFGNTYKDIDTAETIIEADEEFKQRAARGVW